MATEQQFRDALIKADKAGDTVSANLFASKIKGLREAQNVNNNSSDMGVPSDSGMGNGQPIAPVAEPQEQGFLDSVGEMFSGSDRETQATRDLPEIGQGGLLAGEDEAKGAAITPALLTATNPQEMADILTNNFSNVGIQSDKQGNLFSTNNSTGARVVLNKPGLSQIDIVQGLGIASAFTPAGRLAGAAKVAAGSGATSAGVEALQALSGGEFDASQVVIDAATAGVLDKAFEVAKSTGRKIRDVLSTDAGIEPATFLSTIRKANSQGVELTRAQSSGDFALNNAEQSVIGNVSAEGDVARKFMDRQQEQLKTAAKNFTDQMGGSSRLAEAGREVPAVTSRAKGEQIQEALISAKELSRQEVSALYDTAEDTIGEAVPLNNNLIVDTADEVINTLPVTKEIRDTIDAALAKFGLVGDSVEPITRNLNAVKDGTKSIEIIGDVTPLSLSNANAFRKQLNKAISGDTTGAAKSVVNQLDEQVRSAIEAGASSGRTDAFQGATAAAKKQFETFSAKDVVQKLVSFKKGTRTPDIDPESVITSITKGDKSVTNIRKVKSVLLESPSNGSRQAWQSIQAEAIGDIFAQSINKNTLEVSGARLNTAISKYKPEALQELLGKKKFAELRRLQRTIGKATIPPEGTTNPSGTFTKLANLVESSGNFLGAGQINLGSLAFAGVKKGKDLANRKKSLDGIINAKKQLLREQDPSRTKAGIEKAARVLAFLEIRDLDKEEE